MRLFAELAKTEDQPDGTIKVWGWASTGGVDSDGETITPEAMKAALPDYMKFGAVREMHQPKAAGTAIEANVRDDGKTWFGAHIVDSEAVKKVKAGVYKGFSVGGKVTDRDALNKSIIKGIKLVEVSLVDRPANPEAVITVMKAERLPEDDVTELAALLDAKTITPGRLLELAKADAAAPAAATPEDAKQPEQSPEQPAADAAKAETVEKGMWNVRTLLDAVQSLDSVCRSASYEATAGEHTAEVVAACKTMLASLGELTQKYLGEELALMMAGKTDALARAAGTDDLAKAQGDTIAKLTADIDALKAEVAKLRDEPAPGKALLKAITVAKADDSNLNQPSNEPDPALTLKGEALALHQIKSMYRAFAR